MKSLLSRFAVGFTVAVVLASPALASAQTLQSVGQYCTSNSQCLSGYCVPGGNICATAIGGNTGEPNSTQGAINTIYLQGYKQSVVDIINYYLVPVLIAVAFIVFLYGIYKYFIAGAAEEGTKGEGRRFAMWGVVGFVIILSLWGIVNIVKDTLVPSTASNTHPNYPTL